MPTLHLLPGESPGDDAVMALHPTALKKLIGVLEQVLEHGESACAEFQQRDGQPYRLCIELIDKRRDHLEWRHTPLAYMRHHARHVLRDHKGRDYDADLLAAHLYAARRARGHNQEAAAAAMGVSTAFVSKVENCRHVPRPESWEKLTAYIGTDMREYELEPEPGPP